jgi:hypothetical protein
MIIGTGNKFFSSSWIDSNWGLLNINAVVRLVNFN